MATPRHIGSSRWVVCIIVMNLTSTLWNGSLAAESLINDEPETEFLTRCRLVKDQLGTCLVSSECMWTSQHEGQAELCYQYEQQYVICCQTRKRDNATPNRELLFLELSSRHPTAPQQVRTVMDTLVLPLVKAFLRSQKMSFPTDNPFTTKAQKFISVTSSWSMQLQRTDGFPKYFTTAPSVHSIAKTQRPLQFSSTTTTNPSTSSIPVMKIYNASRIWRVPVNSKPMGSRVFTASTTSFFNSTATKPSSISATKAQQMTRLRKPTTTSAVSRIFPPTTGFIKSTTTKHVASSISATKAQQMTRFWKPTTSAVSIFPPTTSFIKPAATKSVPSSTNARFLTPAIAGSTQSSTHSTVPFSKILMGHSNMRMTTTPSPKWQRRTDRWKFDSSTYVTYSPVVGPLTPSIAEKITYVIKGCGQTRKNEPQAGGSASFTGFVLSGEKVQDSNKWPWMVSIHVEWRGVRRFLCGGALISGRHVLTAAHCFDGKPRPLSKDVLFVVVGSNRKSSDQLDSDSSLYAVTAVHIHGQYVRQVHYHDVAVITLDGDHPGAAVVCLPDTLDLKSVTARTNATVLGWGLTSYRGASSDILREATVQITPLGHCRNFYQNLHTQSLAFGITTDMICAGSPLGGVDACEGDSGGPLMVLLGTRWVQVGIVSFGYGCGLEDYPGVYTRVASYKEWIEQVVDGSTQETSRRI